MFGTVTPYHRATLIVESLLLSINTTILPKTLRSSGSKIEMPTRDLVACEAAFRNLIRSSSRSSFRAGIHHIIVRYKAKLPQYATSSL